MDEYKFLLKLLDKKIKYPYKVLIKNPHKGVLSLQYYLNDRKELLRHIKEIEQAKKSFYKCFVCNKYFKEGIGARYLPMDKRESGDGLFGETFVCYKCVPKEFGRL